MAEGELSTEIYARPYCWSQLLAEIVEKADMLTIGLARVCHDAVVLPPVCSAPVHQSVPSSYACRDGYCFLQALAQAELRLSELMCVPAYSLLRHC